jgi:hypothetical protein
LIEHPDSPPRHVVLPTELMVRRSCGAYRERGDRPPG